MTNFVLINPFEVPEDIDDDQFLEGWGQAADYMRSQPGFVGTQLHRAVSPNPRFRFVNVAEWASPQDFQARDDRKETKDEHLGKPHADCGRIVRRWRRDLRVVSRADLAADASAGIHRRLRGDAPPDG
jgi:heme-degrading monooxygenase HmoA